MSNNIDNEVDQESTMLTIEELEDPITYELMEYPVSLPCCGRAISRESLLIHFANTPLCPLCKMSFSDYGIDTEADIKRMPKQKNIAYHVEQAKKNGVDLYKEERVNPKYPWRCRLNILESNTQYDNTVLGKLTFYSNNKSPFKTLVVPVIDVSGSMGFSETGTVPLEQCKHAARRIVELTYKHDHLITEFITYSTDRDSFSINKNQPKEENMQLVNQICIRGGTSFSEAFLEIMDVFKKYNNEDDISHIEIIFLTDGEDTSVGAAHRHTLIEMFVENLGQFEHKPFTLHTVGFGQEHDFEFLDGLRKIGDNEGAYRYADPGADVDSLLNKISSITDVISQEAVIPLTIEDSKEFPIIRGEDNVYWVNLTNVDMTKHHTLIVKVGKNEAEEIDVSVAEDCNDEKIWDQWYSCLVDDIAGELMELSTQSQTLEKELHCELIDQRCKAIMSKIETTNPLYIRIENILETLESIKQGIETSQRQLVDMKFEGKYATKNVVKRVQNAPVQYQPRPVYVPAYTPYVPKVWETNLLDKCRRLNAKGDAPEFAQVIGKKKSRDVVEWIDQNHSKLLTFKDEDSNNAIAVAALIGRVIPLKKLLEYSELVKDINNTNDDGYTALDLAMLYGYWHSSEILIKHGAKTNKDNDVSFRSCLSQGYFNTASLASAHQLVAVTDDFVDNAPTAKIATWLSNRTGKAIPLNIAIKKGIYERVHQLVVEKPDDLSHDMLSWKEYTDVLKDPSVDHIRIIKLLLEHKKIDPCEEFENPDDPDDTLFPLFLACEKGNQELFSIFESSEMINKQTKQGTTCLWIASNGGHVDIVSSLLSQGADPNLCNAKGDGSIVPACNNGRESIVEMLLAAEVRLDTFNPERDNPILICCRKGHSSILETLLDTLEEDELKTYLSTYNPIDGFIPLLAATELDNVECIKVCIDHGANLEDRTEDTNTILPGATALHLACFYGRQKSAIALKELGSDLKSQTTTTLQTPLHLAIKHGHINIVRFLLSTDEGVECLEMKDLDGRIPAYYAIVEGNEEIFEEFFSNKLTSLLHNVILSEPTTEKKCSDVLVKYGQSLGCYSYENITNVDMGDGSTLLSYALLNKNNHIVDQLFKMGVNITKPDDFGVTPLFWANYLGYIKDTQDSKETVQMLENINQATKGDFQAKMLLSIKPGQQKMIKNGNMNDQTTLAKMSDGFDMLITKETIESLRNTYLVDHSIMGFVDKLKKKKLFSNKHGDTSYILLDAKINIIKRIAQGETVLKPKHIMAIYLYTSNAYIFKSVNMALENLTKKNVLFPFINCLYQGISMLECYEGEAYRGVDAMFTMEDYEIGKTIEWNTFSLCSYEWKNVTDLIQRKRGIVFIIKSKSGRKISKYSKYPMDAEVMFLPGTTFKVTNHYKADVICLGQANIRDITFKIKEKDYKNAVEGKRCIIVELTEQDVVEAEEVN